MTESETLRRGFLFLIDKPPGLTSHDVVERVRKATTFARIGHSGTLDPMATGLLLLCAGGAARLQSFFTRMDKSYEGVIRLGRSTTTYDREGETVGTERDPSGIDPGEIESAAAPHSTASSCSTVGDCTRRALRRPPGGGALWSGAGAVAAAVLICRSARAPGGSPDRWAAGS